MNFISFAKSIALSGLLIWTTDSFATGEIETLQTKLSRASKNQAKACYGVEAEDGGWGSAVLISSDGRFLTSAHLFKGNGEELTLHQVGRPPLRAKVIRYNREIDIALLETLDSTTSLGPGVRIPSASANTSDRPIEVISFGHASGFRAGRPAPLRFGYAYSPNGESVISNCHLTIGDSGGGIFNLEGELLGIHCTVERSGDHASHVPVSVIIDMWPTLDLKS